MHHIDRQGNFYPAYGGEKHSIFHFQSCKYAHYIFPDIEVVDISRSD